MRRQPAGSDARAVELCDAANVRKNPNLEVTSFRWSEKSKQHMATPDDPHWSAEGKDYARIEAAMGRGDMTTEEAVEAYL